MSNEFPDDLGKEVSSDFRGIERQAKESIRVFISGSYKDKTDEQTLISFKDSLYREGITGAFLMRDVPVAPELEKQLDKKFLAIWNRIKSRNPCFILYAGKSAESSQGFLAEMSTIHNNEEMLNNAYLFRIEGVQLPHIVEDFPYVRDIKDEKQFFELAWKVVQSKINLRKTYLTHAKAERK